MEDDIVEGEHVRHTYRPFPVVAKENGIAIEQLKLVTRQDPRGELRGLSDLSLLCAFLS